MSGISALNLDTPKMAIASRKRKAKVDETQPLNNVDLKMSRKPKLKGLDHRISIDYVLLTFNVRIFVIFELEPCVKPFTIYV